MLALVFSHLSRTAEQGFCEGARLPQNGNRRVYLTAYYIACLPESVPTRKEQLARALRCVDGSVGVAPVVVAPDMHALRDAVVGARHVGRVCDDIRLFKVTSPTAPPIMQPLCSHYAANPQAHTVYFFELLRAGDVHHERCASGARRALAGRLDHNAAAVPCVLLPAGRV